VGIDSIGRALRSAAGVGLASGALIGCGLAAWIAALEGWGPGRDALLLALYLSALYAILGTLGLAALALPLGALGIRPPARVFAGLAAGIYLLLNGLLYFNQAFQFLSITPHESAVGLLDLAGVALASAAAGIGVATRLRRRRLLALGSAAVLVLLLEGVSRWHERPRVRDLSSVPALLARAPGPAPAPSPEPFPGARLLVLGFDGLSWEVLLPLLEANELPSFRTLLSRAAYSSLATLDFAISPVVWEVISTGQPPERHGIAYHFHFDFPGLQDRVRHLPHSRLDNSFFGVRKLLSRTAGRAPWRQVPVQADDARRARLWEIAGRAGLRVGVYDWLNASPLAPVDAFIHGYGPFDPKLYPADLDGALPALSDDPPAPRPGLPWVLEAWPAVSSGWDRFIWLARHFQPELLFYYEHVSDSVNHVNWKHDVVGDGILYSGLQQPELHHGEAVVAAMRLLDVMLGDALSRLPPEASLVVVSDHGFDYRGYEHDNAPPGVLILSGPGIPPGPFEGPTVYDVAPTLLQLLGLPAAEDMPGRVLPVALGGGPREGPLPRVASHGPALPPLAKGGSNAARLRQHEEYLRALGYAP